MLPERSLRSPLLCVVAARLRPIAGRKAGGHMLRGLVVVCGFACIIGCHRTVTTPMSATPAATRVALDSAEIDRLCLRPDSVRAGLAECVLKDQSPPPLHKPLEKPPQ